VEIIIKGKEKEDIISGSGSKSLPNGNMSRSFPNGIGKEHPSIVSSATTIDDHIEAPQSDRTSLDETRVNFPS